MVNDAEQRLQQKWLMLLANCNFFICLNVNKLTIQAVTKSPIHVPTAAIFMKLSFLMPM